MLVNFTVTSSDVVNKKTKKRTPNKQKALFAQEKGKARLHYQ